MEVMKQMLSNGCVGTLAGVGESADGQHPRGRAGGAHRDSADGGPANA